MIRNIVKQLWNSRRTNGWIFGEMVVVFVAMWLVIDPIYTTVYQVNMFDKGFDPDKLYILDIELNGEVAEQMQGDEFIRDFKVIQQRVREYPGVESSAPISSLYIWSGATAMRSFVSCADTSRAVDGQMLRGFQGSDYFKIFRFRDVTSGSYLQSDSLFDQPNGVFITENVEEILFGRGNGVGKEFSCSGEREVCRVLGVIENVKGSPIAQATPLMILCQAGFENNSVSSSRVWGLMKLAFRIHDHEPEDLFIERFREELFPRLSVGGLVVSEITSIKENEKELLNAEGVSGKLELQTILVIFFLLNISLAVFAAFWLRVRKRRGEIGVMLALGNSAGGIRKYFLTESLVLFGCSVLVGMIVLVQILYLKGGACVLSGFSAAEKLTTVYREGWPINHPAAHFIFVTLFTLVILGGTILLGTWLPALRASRIRPADALREE